MALSVSGRGGRREGPRQADIPNLDIVVRPLVEKLDGADLSCDFFGKDLIPAGVLDLDFAIVRHDCVRRSRLLLEESSCWFRMHGNTARLASAVWAPRLYRAEG